MASYRLKACDYDVKKTEITFVVDVDLGGVVGVDALHRKVASNYLKGVVNEYVGERVKRSEVKRSEEKCSKYPQGQRRGIFNWSRSKRAVFVVLIAKSLFIKNDRYCDWALGERSADRRKKKQGGNKKDDLINIELGGMIKKRAESGEVLGGGGIEMSRFNRFRQNPVIGKAKRVAGGGGAGLGRLSDDTPTFHGELSAKEIAARGSRRL